MSCSSPKNLKSTFGWARFKAVALCYKINHNIQDRNTKGKLVYSLLLNTSSTSTSTSTSSTTTN
ncbi:hypothetical protein DFA_01623 [Cavenderia fasciculata]|uniref:Uncharacterized protein n=1 Tax=Cavenderia fasciculata TaxID=261658 RepID=F4PTR7_CACFS|nr:uncharacterized protein DFA_01623 [Cavenderia fasciculata]EGG21737.1 hypothetical protein DFA_01623 [Cavenderia fasciculata]|eukprot:XP_004359587.1 hypothetical protein DFA_01623 [Cavenderia fasciculata]